MKKFWIWLGVFLFIMNGYAFADRDVELIPGPSDFTVSEIKEIAATFFSRKCGISQETLMLAGMEIHLLQNEFMYKTDNGSLEWKPVSEARWVVHIESFPYPYNRGSHPGYHELQLTRDGDLICWSAHGMEYYEEAPDIVAMGNIVTPLEIAAQEEDIICAAKQDLVTLYNVEDVDEYEFRASFLYEEHFNNGSIPVWIVYVCQHDTLVWKGAYGYNSCLMCLVPAEQDYSIYTTPDQESFCSYFWRNFEHEELKKFSMIEMGKATEDEIIEWVKKYQSIYQKWKESNLRLYPSSGDLYIEALIRMYGK